MKTEAIRQAAERLRASGHFGLASQVDEEADALLACALALSRLVTMVEEDYSFNDPAKEPDQYAALAIARDALKKAKPT